MFILTFDFFFFLINMVSGNQTFNFLTGCPHLESAIAWKKVLASEFRLSADIFSGFPQQFFKRLLSWVAEKPE